MEEIKTLKDNYKCRVCGETQGTIELLSDEFVIGICEECEAEEKKNNLK